MTGRNTATKAVVVEMTAKKISTLPSCAASMGLAPPSIFE